METLNLVNRKLPQLERLKLFYGWDLPSVYPSLRLSKIKEFEMFINADKEITTITPFIFDQIESLKISFKYGFSVKYLNCVHENNGLKKLELGKFFAIDQTLERPHVLEIKNRWPNLEQMILSLSTVPISFNYLFDIINAFKNLKNIIIKPPYNTGKTMINVFDEIRANITKKWKTIEYNADELKGVGLSIIKIENTD